MFQFQLGSDRFGQTDAQLGKPSPPTSADSGRRFKSDHEQTQGDFIKLVLINKGDLHPSYY